MRTTVKLDEDVAAAAEKLRRERNIGLSDAINALARAGLERRPVPKRFRQRTADLGLAMDVSNVAEALEILEATGQDP